MQDAIGTQNLHNIYSVYEKLKGQVPGAPTAGTGSEASSQPATAANKPSPEAEILKSAGNAAMQQKDFKTAIAKYTEAISISPTNPVYLSNRAAAYSASGDHAAAAADAEVAVAAQPTYTKAWSRLGLAKFALGDAKGSAEAYEKGIEYEGDSGSEAMKKGLETARRRATELEKQAENVPADEVDRAAGSAPGAGSTPDLASLGDMFGGAGGGGGGGGAMPDLAGMMNNPMFAGMARNLMQNPGALQGLMNNPKVQQMMQGMQGAGAGRDGNGAGGGAGGAPDLASLMNDPNIASL